MLEFTETSALLDPRRTGAVLDSIRHSEVRLAVDDFGAGNHAPSRLRHLPLDALKLDRGFVAELDDGRTACMVSALINLAHELDMDVVAEGVETADHVRALRERGFDLVQGYYFAPALDVDGAGALARRSEPDQVPSVAFESGVR